MWKYVVPKKYEAMDFYMGYCSNAITTYIELMLITHGYSYYKTYC